jgi:FlaG/FlaF family flagellin (archaellin)
MSTPPPDPKPLPVLALVAAVLLLAGAFTAVFVLGRMKQNSSPPKASASTAQTASAVDGPGKESQFLRRLEVQNLQLDRSDAAAVKDAHYVCGRFLSGESKDQVVQDILQGSPGMSIDTATDFADTAIDVYCPDGHRDDPT